MRNLLRVADGLPFVVPYLLGVVVALTGGDRRRIGDRAASTRIVARWTAQPAGRSRANTRKVGSPTGSSPNSGLTQPVSSVRER